MAKAASTRKSGYRAVLVAVLVTLPLIVVSTRWSYLDASLIGAVDSVEELTYDEGMSVRATVLRATGHVPKVDSDIVLVEYDDDTDLYYRQNGFTSFYSFYAKVLGRIAEAKPRAVFVDYLYRYNSTLASLGHALHDVLAKPGAIDALSAEDRAKIQSIEDDLTSADRFADAMKAVPTYLPANCFSGADVPFESTEIEKGDLDRLGKAWVFPAPAKSIHTSYRDIRFQFPNDVLLERSAGVIQSCEMKDPGNILRRDLPVISVVRLGKEYLVPNATVVVAALAMGLDPKDISTNEEGVLLGSHLVPTDAEARTPYVLYGGRLDFRNRSHQGHANTIPAHALLERPVDPGMFRDKVVLVGETHSASGDKKLTPLSSGQAENAVPGVELIAAQADAMTRSEFPLRIPRWLETWGVLLSLAALALGIVVGQSVDPHRPASVVLGAAAVASIPVAGLALFTIEGIWLRPFFPTATAVLASGVGVLDGYLASRKERQLIRDSFAKMVSPEIVDDIIASGRTPEFGGVDLEMTMLFADLRGFTSKSEQMPAAEMVDLLNEHLDAMAVIIRSHGGTVDKFIGDCVMAFWGSPRPDPDHALHACQAGIEMLAEVDRANERRRAEGRVELAIGVGVNTGRVVVGNMGSRNKLDYTVIGDPVNLASRFEGMTKDTGYGALIGESTAAAVAGRVAVDPLGGMKVKGKAAPVQIFGLTLTRKIAPAVTTAASS